MTKNYQTFIEHTGSTLTKGRALLNEYFKTYQFSSEYGKGFTAVYGLDSYANICIAEHSYTSDFEYSVSTEDSITIQQYDSIDSDRRYPQGDVSAGQSFSVQFKNYTGVLPSDYRLYRAGYMIK